MKITSTRLEVFAELNSDEFEKLRYGVLSGMLRFYDDPSPTKIIPIKIELIRKQKKLLKVETEPKEPKDDYFGRAKNVRFRINDKYYNYVNDNGIFSYRFFTTGKLTMAIEQKYDLY